MPVVIAFDTSMNACSLTVYNSETGGIWNDRLITDRGQAEKLVPMIKALLVKSGHSFPDIDRIGITTGPGSFTGLRVGLATARHLGLALNKPELGYSTLKLLQDLVQISGALKPDEQLLGAIDTQRGDFSALRSDEQDARIIPAAEMTAMLDEDGLRVAGDLGADLKDHKAVPPDHHYPDTGVLAKWVQRQDLVLNHFYSRAAPKAIYMRDAEISQPKRIFHTLGQ